MELLLKVKIARSTPRRVLVIGHDEAGRWREAWFPADATWLCGARSAWLLVRCTPGRAWFDRWGRCVLSVNAESARRAPTPTACADPGPAPRPKVFSRAPARATRYNPGPRQRAKGVSDEGVS